MSKKKKILVLNYEFPPLGGGASNATKYLLQEFAKKDDLQIDLITSSTNKFQIEKPADNITIHYLNINKNGDMHYQSNKDLLTYSWKAYLYAKNLIKTNNFDLIHAFFGIPCGFIAQQLKLPYIVSLRGSDVPFYNPRFEKLDKLIFQHLSKNIWKNSKATIANSQGLKDLALKTSPNQKIELIYNGIDITEFHPSKTKLHTPLRILAVGRLIPRKGFDILLQASKDLDIEVTIIGDGPEKNNLQAISKDNKIQAHFTGAIEHDKIITYYQESDIFVLPSANEGMSNTVLEAMACGLPIITTNTGGTQELVKENGWIIKRNVKELRKALESAISNPKQLNKMGQESRKKVESMTWEKVADEYRDVYKHYLN